MMTNTEIVDTLDDIAVSIWKSDDDSRYPAYTGKAREHYRRLAKVAVKSMAHPSWALVLKQKKKFRFGIPKEESILQAYQGILEGIAHESLYDSKLNEDDDT